MGFNRGYRSVDQLWTGKAWLGLASGYRLRLALLPHSMANDPQLNGFLKEEDSVEKTQVKPGMNVAFAVFAHISPKSLIWLRAMG